MRPSIHLLGAGFSTAIAIALCATAQAQVTLFQFDLNQDGNITTDTVPPGSTFSQATGFGTITLQVSSPGTHSALMYADYDLGAGNNLAEVFGSPPPGLSWEAGPPGGSIDDIYGHFTLGGLNSANQASSPADVAMALGWNFTLSPGQVANVNFTASQQPPQGFYLRQYDPGTGDNVYFSSTYEIAPVPEISSSLVVGVSLMGLASARWRKRRIQQQ